MLYEKNSVIRSLKEGVLEITYIKKDGSTRVGKFTLDTRYLPTGSDMKYIDEQHAKTGHEDLIAVWELDKSQWRSFYIQNVTYIQSLPTM